MKKIYFIVLVMIMTSCSLFMSKDEKLTADKWIQSSSFISKYKDGKSEHKQILYKKSEENLTFKFDMDGTVRITEDNGLKFATITWNWRSDKKKYIQLNRGKYYGDFLVLELTPKILKLSKSDISTIGSEIMTFMHPDSDEWYSDEEVEEMNKILNN